MSSITAIAPEFKISNNTLKTHPNVVAAKRAAMHLSKKIRNSFQKCSSVNEVIRPVFNALSLLRSVETDRITIKGFLEGLPFAQACMRYGGSNADVGKIRAFRKFLRQKESSSYRIEI